MNKHFYIFESGATKTDVLYYRDGQVKKYALDGYNPNRPASHFLSDLTSIEIAKGSQIFFYGSGIHPETHKISIQQLFKGCEVFVENDLLAAARAALGHQKGIISINGTGANVGYYDGQQLLDSRGGYGYLIDDIGGGLELGKLIISHWLSQDFNQTSQNAISQVLDSDPENFISNFYQDRSLTTLAKPCTVLHSLIPTDAFLESVIQHYFETYAERHIIPFSKKYVINEVSAVGSIAYYFQDQFNVALGKNGIKLASVIEKPIDTLLDYHLTEM